MPIEFDLSNFPIWLGRKDRDGRKLCTKIVTAHNKESGHFWAAVVEEGSNADSTTQALKAAIAAGMEPLIVDKWRKRAFDTVCGAGRGIIAFCGPNDGRIHRARKVFETQKGDSLYKAQAAMVAMGKDPDVIWRYYHRELSQMHRNRESFMGGRGCPWEPILWKEVKRLAYA